MPIELVVENHLLCDELAQFFYRFDPHFILESLIGMKLKQSQVIETPHIKFVV